MYTYKDFEDKAKEYGFTGDQISEADYKLARMNPDAGVALLGYKNDWLTADNDSAKAMAHAAAEDIRSRYGNYSGGASGGSYTPTGAAQYEDPWEQAIRSTMKNLENRSFEWSPQTDPTLKYYEDAYRREGQRAMKDTLGTVAATTGGIPSSYATAAAAQQNNYYAQQLTDKYTELYQQAYENFLKEYDSEYQMLSAYNTMSERDHSRWLNQQELDRNARLDRASAEQQAYENQMAEEELQFEKDKAAQEIAIENERLRIMEEELELSIKKFDHEVQTAIKDDAYRWAALIQEGKIAEAEQEYRNSSLALEEKEIAMRYAYQYAELDYNRDVLAEESRQADLDREHQLILAQIEERLARDQITASKDAEELEMATVAASYGDFSALKALGYDVSTYEAIYNKKMAEELNPTTEEEGTEEDVINHMAGQTGGENIMKRNDPSGYDLNASVIDQLAAEAPTYKAKADAEKEAQNAKNEEDYGKKYASYLAGDKLSNEEKKNLDYVLDNWIEIYRSGENLTDEAKAVVERYNSESTMQDLFNRYMDGKYMLPTEEKMMKSFVENAYNKYLLGQKVTPTEESILKVWLNGRKTKVGKRW